MPAKVVVRNLRKRYGAVEAARGVSFEVHDGEIFGLIGPNGAGKTTTLECVLGLREPDEGDIEVCGIDARKHPFEVKERIGAALQTTALQDRITPREALDLFGAFYRQRADTETLLDRFSLSGLRRTSSSIRSRAASANDSRSPSRSSISQTWCSSTSPPPGSILTPATNCTARSCA